MTEDTMARFKVRVQRQCARDHEVQDLIQIMQSNLRGVHDFSDRVPLIEWYRNDVQAWRLWSIPCRPWPQIEVVEVRRVYNTKSEAAFTIEVIYGKDGKAGALYGVDWDGKVRLWAD